MSQLPYLDHIEKPDNVVVLRKRKKGKRRFDRKF